MITSYDGEASLGQQIFGHAQLGDRRRNARLAMTFDLMRKHPGGMLPDKLPSPADLRAFYRLCDSEAVTHAAVIAAARQHTLDRIAAYEGPVLVVHDATELDYTSLNSLAGDLGQIGSGRGRGYICHNSLAVAAETREVLGLLDQVLHKRDETPRDETLAQHRARDTRESLLWIQGTRHLPSTTQLIDVADQGADTFEFLEHELRSGRRFVVRACKQRKVTIGHTGEGRHGSLKEIVDVLPELGRFKMPVQAQPGRPARRLAEFVVRGAGVLVHPPHAKHGHHGDDPLPLYAVQVTETSPPAGAQAITWTLLTNEPVHNLNDAWRVVGWYELRWVIEELNKAKKTGCGIEDMQFCTTARLEPAIALLTIVALTLLNLRDASRRPDAKTRRADTLLAPDYVAVLSGWRYKQARANLTVHEFYFALARLGGHQNRKSDRPPGWLVLWRGWQKLQAMLDGFDVARRLKKW